MEFAINVIQNNKTNATTKTQKPYVVLELAYKNMASGKLESKKLMPFGNTQNAHKVLSSANAGDTFLIKSEKNSETGYWDWVDAKQQAPGSVAATPPTGNVRSTYETPEERAKKQVYIVKQSSLASAVQLLSIGAKQPPSTELILQEAQKFVDWVFAEEKVSLAEMPNDFPDVQ